MFGKWPEGIWGSGYMGLDTKEMISLQFFQNRKEGSLTHALLRILLAEPSRLTVYSSFGALTAS